MAGADPGGAGAEPSVWQRLLNDFHPLKGGDRREAALVVLGAPSLPGVARVPACVSKSPTGLRPFCSEFLRLCGTLWFFIPPIFDPNPCGRHRPQCGFADGQAISPLLGCIV